jgi:hypothetical protein
MVVLSPISAVVFSPLNLRSCGTALITEPGKILQFFPIRAPSMMVTFGPIQVPFTNHHVFIDSGKWLYYDILCNFRI